MIKDFEDLECWKKCRLMTKMIYQYSSTGLFAKDFDLRSQIRRAAVSSMNNIAEGHGRSGIRDVKRFLEFASSSLLEIESMLYLIKDLEYLTDEQISELRVATKDALKLTLGYIKYYVIKIKNSNR